MRLERVIPGARMKSIWKMCSSNDSWARLVAKEAVRHPTWYAMWKSTGGKAEDTPEWDDDDQGEPRRETVLNLPDWRSDEHEAWAGLPSQGMGVAMFKNDRISNSWIRDPEHAGFKQKHYLRGLAMRSGMTITQTQNVKGDGKKGNECARCGAKSSTMAHILGQCGHVKNNIIRRHNKLCNNLKEEMERLRWKVLRDLRITGRDGQTKVPDIVAMRKGHGIIIDVTVRYESLDFPLEEAAEEKVRKYQTIKAQVMHMLGAKDMGVYGFPLGARGKWPSCNEKVLKAIGMSAGRRISFGKYMSRRTLLYSIDVLNSFIEQ